MYNPEEKAQLLDQLKKVDRDMRCDISSVTRQMDKIRWMLTGDINDVGHTMIDSTLMDVQRLVSGIRVSNNSRTHIQNAIDRIIDEEPF